MKPPPALHPPTLGRQFAADPFDPRMHRASPNREHTALGLLVEIWHWYETHQAECGPAFKPIVGSVRELIERECPDVFADFGIPVPATQPPVGSAAIRRPPPLPGRSVPPVPLPPRRKA